MKPELKQLEREVERQLAELGEHLRAPGPSARCIASVRSAVSAEARRLRQRQRRLVLLRPWAGIAAAALLVLGLSLPRAFEASAVAVDLGEDADAIVVGWVDALVDSGEQFTRLLEEDWLLNGSGAGDESTDGVDPLDSLEESLDSFAQLIGA